MLGMDDTEDDPGSLHSDATNDPNCCQPWYQGHKPIELEKIWMEYKNILKHLDFVKENYNLLTFQKTIFRDKLYIWSLKKFLFWTYFGNGMATVEWQ